MFINRVIPINNVKIQQDKKVNFCAADFLEVKNLTNEISKKIYGKEGAMNVYKKFPAAEGISIGSTGIPAQWLKKVKDLANFNMPLFCENLGRILCLIDIIPMLIKLKRTCISFLLKTKF